MTGLAAADLFEILDLALERAGTLLTAGELVVVRAIRALSEDAAEVYARLTSRKPVFFCVDALDLPGFETALPTLETAGLVDRLVPWTRRATLLPLRTLRPILRARGLPSTGRKASVVQALDGLTHWTEHRFIRVRHKRLIERLTRWALLSVYKDRTTLVRERMGQLRWPAYRLTAGAMVHADRRQLLRWEALLETQQPEAILRGLDRGDARAPAGLDLTRALIHRVYDAARTLEREGAPSQAVALYERLHPHVRPGVLAVRQALALDAAGARAEALAVLAAAKPTADESELLAIDRCGRRLSRRRWAPSAPLRKPMLRDVRLSRAPTEGRRPRWLVDDASLLVEAACLKDLSHTKRRGLFAEGGLWTTLFALLFVDTAYFLPLAGALPVARLRGPTDLGTPQFAARRQQEIANVFDTIRAGEAVRLAERAWDRHEGERLAGAHWTLTDKAILLDVIRGIGDGLIPILEALLRGWHHSRGLPDLVILPGPVARWPSAFPTRLTDRLLLAEVKGPGDSLRDDQRVWHDRLIRAGVAVEIWKVRPA